MKYGTGLLILLFLNSFYGTAQDEDRAVQVINLLKNYKFDVAREQFINRKQADLLDKALLKYITIREFSGQVPLDVQTSITTQADGLVQYIEHLSIGYQELYTNPYNIIPFQEFSKALTLAKNSGNTMLTAEALRAILNVYDFEIALTNDSYRNYIDRYKTVIKDSIDATYYYDHLLNFQWSELNSRQIDSLTIIRYENAIATLSDSQELEAEFLSNKAVVLEFNQNYETAKKLFKKSLSLLKNKKSTQYLKFRNHVRLLSIALKQLDYQKASTHLDSSYTYRDRADTIRASFYLNAYGSEIAKNQNNFEKAYTLLSKSRIAEIQLDYKKNSIAIGKANVKYRSVEKEKQILEEQAQKRQIAVGLGSTLLLGTIIAFLIYRNTKRKQRIAEQDKELEFQRTEKVLKEKEIETINAMVEGQEKERQRLAGDLHDSIGGTLAALKMHLGTMENTLDKKEAQAALLSKANILISDAYTRVRKIAHERNSGVMAKDGLLPAIQRLARNVSNNSLTVNVQDFGLDKRLHTDLEITIFRIVQELVTNVIKHAQATETTISLTQHEDELNIIIEDNGIGFKVGRLEEKEGMGLGSIERRVEHLEGTMVVDSTLKKGTSIIIDIPL